MAEDGESPIVESGEGAFGRRPQRGSAREASEPPAVRKARLERHRTIAMVVSVIAIGALFLAFFPLWASTEEGLFVLLFPDGDMGNAAAICLFLSLIATVAVPVLIAWHLAPAINAVGLAPLVHVEFAVPAFDQEPGTWPNRFADRRVLTGVKALRAAAEELDAATVDDPALPELEAELGQRLSRLDDAFIGYLADVQDRAEQAAGMSLDELAEEGSSTRKAKARQAVDAELGDASAALQAAYGAFAKLLRGIVRAPATGVSRARGRLGELDDVLEAAERAVTPER